MNWDEMTNDEKRSYCRTLADENLIQEPHHLRWVLGELWSAEQANARLRTALEAVEWEVFFVDGREYCLWCHRVKENGHKSDCRRQQALEGAT